jgi:hypothetical protein
VLHCFRSHSHHFHRWNHHKEVERW